MTRTKKRSTTVFSRDEIGVEQLQSLKEKFADGDLNEKEFVNLFREIIDASLSETQLTELFQKIDANSDGTVDWDELTNYMFLSGSENSEEFLGDDSNAYYETAQPDKLGDVSAVDAIGGRGGAPPSGEATSGRGHQGFGHHKDVVTRIVRLDRPYMYLTASKDGTVRTWNAQTMTYQSQIATGKNWITDCCVMRRSNRLAVASMTRTLGIYDLGSSQLIGEIHEYSRKQCIPLCLEYVEKPADDREALVIGDDTGGITVMTCSNQWMACDGRSSVSPATTNGSASASSSLSAAPTSSVASPMSGGAVGSAGGLPGSMNGSISSSNITSSSMNGTASLLETQGFSSRVKFSKHTDWVTRVKWVNDIRAIVATSLDTTVSIIDIDRLVVKFEYTRHKKGVFDLVWCASTRLIASCGMERDISIWNPYSSQRAVATLRGHTSSVLHLASDDDNYQLISVSADNTFKVWDVRNHRCLQTFVDNYKSTGGAENRISAVLFDNKQPCLVSATTHLTRWPLKASASSMDQDPQEETGAKEKPMCLASYNTVFHQVVTAEMSTDAVVKTWSAETGDELCSFSNAHDSSPVTAICFDSADRRLLTGAHEGDQLKMWNFSNGALVKQFLKAPLGPSSATTSSATKSTPAVSSDAALYELSAPLSSSSSAQPSSTKNVSNRPPRRKVRDIMVLPASFGMDNEGRRVSPSAMANTVELPSPTRSRLRRGSEQSEERPARYPRSPVAGPSSKHNSRYRQQEVTSVLDIERNLRVGMGDFICQRFVCAVGWDRRIFIWADKNDESEALPVHVLPGSRVGSREDDESASPPLSTSQRCHSMDILALVYIPPAYIATAGLDGKILLWSLNSGEFVAKLHQSDGSIDAMWYAAKLELLFASGENGQLVCVDRSMTTQAVIDLGEVFVGHTKQTSVAAITALRCDKTNTHLVTGDATGAVKVWELGISPDHEGVSLEFCCQWRIPVPSGSTATTNRILGVDFVENFARSMELFLVIACASGEVMLWTLDGVQVGCFGRHRGWQLGRPPSYASGESGCEWPEVESDTDEGGERTRPPNRKHFIKCCSIASCNAASSEAPFRDTSFLLEDSMPKPGEVWVCVSGHRSRAGNANPSRRQDGGADVATPMTPVSPATGIRSVVGISAISSARILLRRTSGHSEGSSGNNCESLGSLQGLQQKLAETASDITDMITVVAVARGEISCIDASAPATPKLIDMSDFVRKAGWTKHVLLSQFIGRTFVEGATNFCVRAVAMSPLDPAKPEKKQFALMDMHANEHKLQPLNHAVSLARFKLQDRHGAKASSADRRSSSVTVKPGIERTRSGSAQEPGNSSRSGPTVAQVAATDALDAVLSADVPPVVLAGSVGMGAVTLPLLKPRERRAMGGLLPKRSTVRNRHDPSLDLRRIHNPDDIPKSFRSVLQHKREHRDAPFGGILPDT